MNKYWDNGNLEVMRNTRYFTNGGTPFLLLGDTAWHLFQRLQKEQSEVYLKNRKLKGFNVILSVLITKDKIGAFDFTGQAEYWNHVTYIVKMAEDLGLYLGLLPVWGNVVKDGYLNEDNIKPYIMFLKERFEEFKNIIWIAGGDCRGNDKFSLWDTMGTLLKEYMTDKLVGYHPFGRTSSSYWFHEKSWLDFNLFQSGHRRFNQRSLQAWDEAVSKEPWFGEENWRYVLADYEKLPYKPVMDGEPSYEQIPQGLHDFNEPFWQDFHVRRYAYWSIFAGAAGHIYGHNSVMQFYGKGNPPAYGAKETWDISIHDLGSGQMQFLKSLMEELDFSKSSPMTQILKEPFTNDFEETLVAFGTANKFAVYSYKRSKIELAAISGRYDLYWFDPISGVKSYINSYEMDNGISLITPDKKTAWNDWVLICQNGCTRNEKSE